jgi:hypothetical protein
MVLEHPLHVVGHEKLRPSASTLHLGPGKAGKLLELLVDEGDGGVWLDEHGRRAGVHKDGAVAFF